MKLIEQKRQNPQIHLQSWMLYPQNSGKKSLLLRRKELDERGRGRDKNIKKKGKIENDLLHLPHRHRVIDPRLPRPARHPRHLQAPPEKGEVEKRRKRRN